MTNNTHLRNFSTRSFRMVMPGVVQLMVFDIVLRACRLLNTRCHACGHKKIKIHIKSAQIDEWVDTKIVTHNANDALFSSMRPN